MFAKFLKKKNDNKGITGKDLIKLHNTPIKYASKRNDETYKEEILGREGTINVIDNEIFVVCSGKYIFKSDIYEAYASSLMSGNGYVLRRMGKDNKKTEVTVFLAEYLG